MSQLQPVKRAGWREPAIALGAVGLLVASLAFGRDLIDFTISSGASISASEPSTPPPATPPAIRPVAPITGATATPTPDGYDMFMPEGPGFTSGVVTIGAGGIDLDVDPPRSPAISGGDAEFHTTKAHGFVTGTHIRGLYQWDEAGSPDEDQCSSQFGAEAERSTSIEYPDLIEGTWAFCILTSEGRNAYIVLGEGETSSAEKATSQASVYVW